MLLEEIKAAVNAGKIVHWATGAYIVTKDKRDEYYIKCTLNNSCIGLVWADGTTMNGKPEDFFIAEPASAI